MTYQFIAKHRSEFRVSRMCAVLQVSSSGFYAWLEREPSPREQENIALVELICDIHRCQSSDLWQSAHSC